MSEQNYTLRSGEEAHEAHPETFEIPDRTDRERIPVGYYAKLMFEGVADGRVERMWVKVTGIGQGGYDGTLANDPLGLPLSFGDVVRFGPEHVIDIHHDE